MTQSKELYIVSRVKGPRRTPEEKMHQRRSGQAGYSTIASAHKEKDDATFQNLDDMCSPNKVGFDSLESAPCEHSKIDMKGVEGLPMASNHGVQEEHKTGQVTGFFDFNMNP